jgi:GntR family carbon starvation induced transcriptional regulator
MRQAAPAPPQTAASSSETLIGQAERRIHRDILNGLHAAGARLNVRMLADLYGIGATPIREALTRLAATGFVTLVENRGFRVAHLSVEDLWDIIRVRQLLEVAALRRSMRDGGAEWEAGIAAALRRLEHYIHETERADQGWGEALDDVHKDFHGALVAAAGSRRLIDLQGMFYDQTFRYRQTMFTRLPDLPGFLTEHREIAGLVLDRAGEPACEKLAAHLTRTLQEVYPAAGLPDPRDFYPTE